VTDNNNNNNNNNEEPEVVVVYVCAVTDRVMQPHDAREVPLSHHDDYIFQRRQMWMTRNNALDEPRDISECPWTPSMTWVWHDLDIEYCENCGCIHLAEESETINDMQMCPECTPGWHWCDDHDIHYQEDYGCDYCAEEEDQEDSLVHDYSYRPSPVFRTLRDSTGREPAGIAFTGFELEMECERGSYSDCAEAAVNHFPMAYLKHDGSLNHGFELVTHPMSLDFINGEVNFGALKTLADMGMRSAKTTTCGLHVHINKGFFRKAPSTAYRFMSLFYSNAEMWRRLAGRSSSSYAQWDIGEDTRLLTYTKGIRDNDMYSTNRDRYVAVNVQPTRTIELRFFKGTLRPLTLQARLQAVHAAAEYAMSTRYKVKVRDASSWEAFRNYTTDNDKLYFAFNEYATEKGV
jgi:hypothetical protein